MHVPRTDDRILPELRVVAVIIVAVLVLAAIVLYGLPDRTGQLWAWPIRPRLTALFMGAGYAAGAYFFARVALGSRWHRVGLGLLPVTVFTWCLGCATLLHWDRFTHNHVAFWAWAGLYAVTPFLVPFLWLRNRAADDGKPEADDVTPPRLVRGLAAVMGLGILCLSGLLFFLPGVAGAFWPWSLTPLAAQVIAGYGALSGASLLLVAYERRWSASRVLIESLLIGLLLFLAALPRGWTSFDPSLMRRTTYVGSLVLGLVVLGALYLGVEGWRRSKI